MRIKNWGKFQHFKDRRPPWIKLYRDLLDDDEFFSLGAQASKTLICLWLLASEDENGHGELPSKKKIAFRLRISEKHLETMLSELSHWVEQDDIGLISARYQDGPSETEAYKEETEAKTEKENTSAPASLCVGAQAVGKTGETWEAYRSAYRHRYQTDPVRNARVNGQLAQLIGRLGIKIAPAVATFYLSHNDPLYVRTRHPVNLLLRDAEGLHTQWATGVKATQGEARNAAVRDDVVEQVKRVEALMAGRTR